MNKCVYQISRTSYEVVNDIRRCWTTTERRLEKEWTRISMYTLLLNVNLSYLRPLILQQLRHSDNEDALLQLGSDAVNINTDVLTVQLDASLEKTDLSLIGDHGIKHFLIYASRPVNNTRDADGRSLGVPRNVNIALLGARERCVDQVLGRRIEDVDSRDE